MNTDEGFCPHCGQSFQDGEAKIYCPICGAAHHERCWTEKGGCSNCSAYSEPQKPRRLRFGISGVFLRIGIIVVVVCIALLAAYTVAENVRHDDFIAMREEAKAAFSQATASKVYLVSDDGDEAVVIAFSDDGLSAEKSVYSRKQDELLSRSTYNNFLVDSSEEDTNFFVEIDGVQFCTFTFDNESKAINALSVTELTAEEWKLFDCGNHKIKTTSRSATSTREGYILKKCRNCMYSERTTIPKLGNSSGGSSSATIEPNTWYITKDGLLRFQNIQLFHKIAMRNGFDVGFYPICAHCGTKQTLNGAFVTSNTPQSGIVCCKECGNYTMWKIEIPY